MDWSLRHCARTGHVTYAPEEKPLQDRLRATTASGEAWRCLRCGDYVLGAAGGSGPADDAPLLLRGRQLRDALVIRLLAVERFGRGLLIVLLAYGVHRFSDAKGSLSKVFEQDLPLLRPLADRFGYDINDSSMVSVIRSALSARHSTLTWISAALAAYGLLQLIEGIGLWLLKRWGEYFAAVATSLFLPLEIYELFDRVTLTRALTFVVNVAAVVYLVVSKRLFGVRGGKAAYEAERHSESLIEVEQAAATQSRPHARR